MIPGVVKEAGKRFRDHVALVAPDGYEVTYLDLYRRSEEVAAGLLERGVGPGSVVSLVLSSSPDYVVAYLAAARVGAITAGVNPRLGPQERARIIDRAQPKLVIATDDLTEGIPGDVDTQTIELATNADGILPALRGDKQAPRFRLDPERPVAIVFTSGTTGEPKGALFRNRQLAAVTMFDTGGNWGGGGPMLISTELAHVGFMTKLPWYLRTGARMHMLRRWRAADALRLIADHHMPSVGGIGAQIALMLRLPDFDGYDVSAVKALIVGGARSSPQLIEEAKRRFQAAYSVRYSSTESGGVGTLTAYDAPEEEALLTVGRPREGIDLAIRDEHGRPLPDGEVGEVTLRSPAVMSEYWNDPETTEKTLRDGWLHTQDLGYIDPTGCLRLAGRSKEMFIRGGYNVFPLEVEAVLAAHPAVAEVAVVPREDDVMGEIGVAVVVPTSGHEAPTLDELRSFAANGLAAYKLPEAIKIIDALPLTDFHKVDRVRLQREATTT
ncbi:MAG: class I adenylate-forming enzyme family protein [Actinomycetota bacterium]